MKPRFSIENEFEGVPDAVVMQVLQAREEDYNRLDVEGRMSQSLFGFVREFVPGEARIKNTTATHTFVAEIFPGEKALLVRAFFDMESKNYLDHKFTIKPKTEQILKYIEAITKYQFSKEARNELQERLMKAIVEQYSSSSSSISISDSTNDENEPDWKDGFYLFYLVRFKYPGLAEEVGNDTAGLSNGPEETDAQAFRKELKDLIKLIEQTGQYRLLGDYYFAFAELYHAYSNDLLKDKETGEALSEKSPITLNQRKAFFNALFFLHQALCLRKRKLLVGVDDVEHLLWADLPSFLATSDNFRQWYSASEYVYEVITFLSGLPGQARYDKLVVPNISRWPSEKSWNAPTILEFEQILAKSLGYIEGFCSRDDLEDILEDALGRQCYNLLDKRPALIRFEHHPLIHQVILIPKGTFLVVRIETHKHQDLIEILSLSTADWRGWFTSIKNQNEVYDDNWSVACLVAQIYRDLTTLEERERPVQPRAVSGKIGKPNKPTNNNDDNVRPGPRSVDPIQPAKGNWRWVLIPRKAYVKGGDNTRLERRPLNESELARRSRIQSTPRITPAHIRNLPAGQFPSQKQLELAAELNVRLKKGQTFVRGYETGLQLLSELNQEIGLEGIPHFLVRRRLPQPQ